MTSRRAQQRRGLAPTNQPHPLEVIADRIADDWEALRAEGVLMVGLGADPNGGWIMMTVERELTAAVQGELKDRYGRELIFEVGTVDPA